MVAQLIISEVQLGVEACVLRLLVCVRTSDVSGYGFCLCESGVGAESTAQTRLWG